MTENDDLNSATQPGQPPVISFGSLICLLGGATAFLIPSIGFGGVLRGDWDSDGNLVILIYASTAIIAIGTILFRLALVPWELYSGRGYWLWGADIGVCIAIAALPGMFCWSATCFAVHSANKSVDVSRLKGLACAMHNYHEEHKRFPPVAIRGTNGEALLSWRVVLLPYLGEDELYRAFDLDEPWDSPHNLALQDRMPLAFRCPFPGRRKPDTGTYYQLFVGPGAVFEEHWSASIADITDGHGNTVLIGESLTEVPWTKPEDMRFEQEAPLPLASGKLVFQNQFALADGTVHGILKKDREGKPTELDPLRGYITRAAKDHHLHAELDR